MKKILLILLIICSCAKEDNQFVYPYTNDSMSIVGPTGLKFEGSNINKQK